MNVLCLIPDVSGDFETGITEPVEYPSFESDHYTNL